MRLETATQVMYRSCNKFSTLHMRLYTSAGFSTSLKHLQHQKPPNRAILVRVSSHTCSPGSSTCYTNESATLYTLSSSIFWAAAAAAAPVGTLCAVFCILMCSRLSTCSRQMGHLEVCLRSSCKPAGQ